MEPETLTKQLDIIRMRQRSGQLSHSELKDEIQAQLCAMEKEIQALDDELDFNATKVVRGGEEQYFWHEHSDHIENLLAEHDKVKRDFRLMKAKFEEDAAKKTLLEQELISGRKGKGIKHT